MLPHTRFDGIAWRGSPGATMTRERYATARDDLRRSLDAAQLAAVRLDQAWGQMTHDDLQVDEVRYADVETWWPRAHDFDPGSRRRDGRLSYGRKSRTDLST